MNDKVCLNTIYNENCLETMANMPKDFIDLIITSPPYDNMRKYGGSGFNDFEDIAASLYKVIKPEGIMVWIVGDQTIKGNETGTSFKQALFFKEIGFNLFDTMIYHKQPRGAVGNNKTYWQTFEYMFVFSKGTPKTINLLKDRSNKESRIGGESSSKRLYDGSLKPILKHGYNEKGRRTNVWFYNTGNNHSATDDFAKGHPAIFPEKLANDHIISWSNPNDIVYDPFMGSGTTAKMCILNDRKFIGSELSKDYYDVCMKRLSHTKKSSKILQNRSLNQYIPHH